MYFRIEIEPPEKLEVGDPEDSTVSEALESVYPMGPAIRIHLAAQTWVSLPVSGGVSDIYNAVVRMLKQVEQGVYPFEISFLCSCFTAIWGFSERNGVLTMKTSWTAVIGVSNGCEIRDAHFNKAMAQFEVEKNVFVAEWLKVLRQIKRDLLSAGYGRSLVDFQYLEQLGE